MPLQLLIVEMMLSAASQKLKAFDSDGACQAIEYAACVLDQLVTGAPLAKRLPAVSSSSVGRQNAVGA